MPEGYWKERSWHDIGIVLEFSCRHLGKTSWNWSQLGYSSHKILPRISEVASAWRATTMSCLRPQNIVQVPENWRQRLKENNTLLIMVSWAVRDKSPWPRFTFPTNEACLRLSGCTFAQSNECWSCMNARQTSETLLHCQQTCALYSSTAIGISSVVLTRLSGPRSRPTTFFMVVPGIEPAPPDLQAKNSDHQTTEAVQTYTINRI
jgi:hypothetical protein